MCESRVIVLFKGEERVYEEIACLVLEDRALTLVDINGKRHRVEGFTRALRVEADFLKHTVRVVLE